MGNDKLAIVLMTHRFDETARHCIETAAAMASDDVTVFIGDNSCNPDKWAFMRDVERRSPRCAMFCHERNLGSGGNWVFLMNRQVDEYLCLVNDDDIFAPDYFLAGRDALRADPGCAAASGLFLSLGWRDGQLGIEPAMPYAEPAPVDRIRRYAAYSGFNATNYAVHRRAAVVGFQAYMRERPFFPAYMDQFQTITLLVQGTRAVDPQRQLYVYNNNNWVTRESIDRANAGFYVAVGLPEAFTHLHLLCWAADTVHYFNSTYRPPGLSDDDAAGVVDVLHDRLMRQLFTPYLIAHLPAVAALLAHEPETLKVIEALVRTPAHEPARVLQLFVAVLRAFDGDLADRYQRFVAQSLRPIPRA